MNLILLAVVALTLICALVGYRRGLIKSVLSALGVVGAILLANLLNPYVADFLNNHTGVRDEVRTRIEAGLGTDDVEEQITVYDRESCLEAMDIPEIVKDYIRSNSAEVDKGGEQVITYIDYVVDYLTDMVMRGIAYLMTFLVSALIIVTALAISNIMAGIPIVNGINRFGGVVFGLLQALFITWAAMLVVTFLSAFSWASEMLRMIDDSVILKYIYNKNIFLKIVVDILGNI